MVLTAGCAGIVRHGEGGDGGAGKDGGTDASVNGNSGGASAAGRTSATGGAYATDGASAAGAGGSGARDGGNDGATPTDHILPSCQGLAATCGPTSNESCCDTEHVTGGNFYRSYDGVTFNDQSYPATVSDFWLDRFEVTVGRFRNFVAAWNGGWRPRTGYGKHTHLNDGNGLVNGDDTSMYEQGWDVSWSANVAPSDKDLQSGLNHTWTPAPAGNEKLPINDVNWYQAYAFCIWDGGFLPSEAEWNYAASGGSEQRAYPWSSPPSSSKIDCSYANYRSDADASCDSHRIGAPDAVGSESPKGDGKYGQADLAGNVAEFTLDHWSCGDVCGPYDTPCVDCSVLGTRPPVKRGGSFEDGANALLAGSRDEGFRGVDVGFRCARASTSPAALPECSNKRGGDLVCHGMDRVRCGPDLSTTTPVDTCTAGTETCIDGACVACPSGRAHCNVNDDKCETNLNSVSTCGTSCDNKIACSRLNGTASCTNGTCGTSSCEPGYGDCGGTNDGCETNFNSAATCGTSCEKKVVCRWPTPACAAGVCSAPPSCEGLANDCGPSSNESCCTSPVVTGGEFYRSYDGVTTSPYDFTSKASPATVSDFRLDRFEITVGRFRKFIAAWNGGWRPSFGDGKHAHLSGGEGLLDSDSEYEPGWNPAWSTNIAPTDANLQCDSFYKPWTTSAGPNENHPVSCINWYEAYAFCIWDGGFLPTEAEWNYAASGGSDQRAYPWSSPSTSTAIDCSYANYYIGSATTAVCTSTGWNDVGSESPRGDGKYGQADLAGNVSEWNLDWWDTSSYKVPCSDCSYTNGSEVDRVARGGSFDSIGTDLFSSKRDGFEPTVRVFLTGARCARVP
jgi:formylglycine-generating enzyme required for sulfatase activity